MLKVWIKNGVDVSWKRLSRALHSIGYDNLAQSLAQRDEEQQEGMEVIIIAVLEFTFIVVYTSFTSLQ